MSHAVLASNTGDPEVERSSLRLADDMKRGYSTTPTAHVRDLVADGIKGNGLAVYFAIADRQVSNKGEYFRSNESLAEETGISKGNVQKWLSILRKKHYLSVWYINGGRRMRVLTGVPRGTPTDTEGYSQGDPYKENNTKKTTQQCGVSFLSEKHRVPFGEGSINRLVVSFGLRRVQKGLLAWDAEDHDKIRNPLGWLTRAIKDEYEPRKATRVGQAFPENVFDHDKIIREYVDQSEANANKVHALVSEGVVQSRVAYKIWSSKI